MVNHRSLAKSFGYAWEGIIYAFKNNQNLRIHFILAFVAMLASIFFKISQMEKVAVGLIILLAISAEMVNTSIEQMTDLITQEHRLEAKLAKDVAAGMVLVTSIGAVVLGMIIFVPYILKFLGM